MSALPPKVVATAGDPASDAGAAAIRILATAASQIDAAHGKGTLGPATTNLLIAVLSGALAGAVMAGALLGLHMATGDGGVSRRVERLEQQQRWSQWALQAIAKAQGVDLPPPPPGEPSE